MSQPAQEPPGAARSPWVRRGLRVLLVLPFVAAGVAVWKVFFPANMPYDGITQFRHAWTGQFDNWHPPLMAITLHLFLKAGRNIGALTLVQCLAGLFGLRALVLAWLRAFFGPRFPPLWGEGIAVLITAVLLLPVSPLSYYLTTFWKDSWSAFVLLWLCAVALRIASDPEAAAREPWGRARIALLLALSAALGLVRHNALVLLPLVGLVLWSATRRASRRLALGLTVAPLLAFGVSEAALERIFHVQDSHLERHVMAFDLVGICAMSEEACGEMPFIRRHVLVPNLRERYVPGNLALTFWSEPPVFDASALWDPESLREAYLRTAWNHPLLFVRLKLEAFEPLLGLQGPNFYFYDGISPNEFNLRPNERFAPVRAALAESLRAITHHRWLRLVSSIHLVWIVIDVVWIAVLLATPGRRSLALVLLLPLAFYLSYLLSAPARDYRFMYPATLVLQAITFAWLFGIPVQWWAARRRG